MHLFLVTFLENFHIQKHVLTNFYQKLPGRFLDIFHLRFGYFWLSRHFGSYTLLQEQKTYVGSLKIFWKTLMEPLINYILWIEIMKYILYKEWDIWCYKSHKRTSCFRAWAFQWLVYSLFQWVCSTSMSIAISQFSMI